MLKFYRNFIYSGLMLTSTIFVGCATETRWEGEVVAAGSMNGRQYIKAPWATMNIDEAAQRCYQEIWSNPTLMTTHYMCMKAKGYQER